jgi:hypothetical protein
MGIVFLITSLNIQEYKFDYTECLVKAPVGKYARAPLEYGKFEWRRLTAVPSFPEFSGSQSDDLCEIKFKVEKEMGGPVFIYYGLSNYYQNQRLYVKSVDWKQLRGEAMGKDQLGACAPLIGPDDDKSGLVYYPCGLIANSMFNGIFIQRQC